MCGATSTLGSAMRSASESRRSAGRAPTRCAGTRAENSGDGAARKLAVGAISAACSLEMSVHHARQGAPRPRRPARGKTPCPCTHRHQRQPGRSHTAPAKNRHPACSSVDAKSLVDRCQVCGRPMSPLVLSLTLRCLRSRVWILHHLAFFFGDMLFDPRPRPESFTVGAAELAVRGPRTIRRINVSFFNVF